MIVKNSKLSIRSDAEFSPEKRNWKRINSKKALEFIPWLGFNDIFGHLILLITIIESRSAVNC